MTPDQLAQLTDTGLCIVNRLLLATGRKEQHFTPMPLADAKAIMLRLSSIAE